MPCLLKALSGSRKYVSIRYKGRKNITYRVNLNELFICNKPIHFRTSDFPFAHEMIIVHKIMHYLLSLSFSFRFEKEAAVVNSELRVKELQDALERAEDTCNELKKVC